MIQTPEDRVLEVIKGAALTDGQIATRTGLGRPTVRRVLQRLEAQGRAEAMGNLQIAYLSKPLWGARA